MYCFFELKKTAALCRCPLLLVMLAAALAFLLAACSQDSPPAGTPENPQPENPVPETPAPIRPSPPAAVSAEGGAGWVLVSWLASPSTETSSYEIWYGAESTVESAELFAQADGAAAGELYIAPLDLNRNRYYVFVKAKDDAGSTSDAKRASVYTKDDADGDKNWREAFTSLAAMGQWLASQPENAAANPYYVGLKGVNLRPLRNTSGADVGFGPFYEALAGRYTAVNVDACTGATAFFAGNWLGNVDHQWRDRLVSIRLPLVSKRVSWHFFKNCASLKRVVLPPRVETIGENCFQGSSALEEIELPASLIKIESEVFKDCAALKKIIFRSETPPAFRSFSAGGVARDVFTGTHAELTILVPAASAAAYKAALSPYGAEMQNRVRAIE